MKKGIIGLLTACMLFNLVVVSHTQKVEAAESSFVKVTENLTDWSGIYLIAYEEGNRVFDGSLTKLDATSNYHTVEINEGVIEEESSSSLLAKTFTITKVGDNYNIVSAGGYYIGNGGNSNALQSSTSVQYENTISLNNDGSVEITSSGGSILRYNANSGQDRFRYFKSATYTEQKPIHLYKLEGSDISEDTDLSPQLINSLVKGHYNDGTYTKKSNIYVNDTVEKFDLASSFHKPSDEAPVYKDRTTYYTPNALLMGDYDGGFEDINSGYRNETDGHMWHYSFDSSTNKAINDWKVNNTTIQKFYVTLDKMLEENYFEGWSYTNGVATYTVENSQDDFVKDFLAFTAPCLEPVVLSSTYSNYFDIEKLEIKEEKGNNGQYLALRIYLNSTNSGSVSNKDCILSEARIYVGNKIFDEDLRNVKINAGEGGTINCDVDTSKPVKLDTELTFTVSVDDDYELATFTINGSDKLQELTTTGSVKWTVKKDVTVEASFKSTLVSEDIIFEFGNNGSATHADGTSASSYTETSNRYTLNLTNVSKFYKDARDAKGNSCIKLGASGEAGKFTFTVPNDVTEVIIYAAKYKSNTTKITVNGASYTLTKNSNDGNYDEIVVNTSSTKTVSFTTVSGGYRCMVNSIKFVK